MKVVMYHYVHPKQENWLKGLKALDLDNFRKQLDYLQSNYHIVRPDDFLDAMECGEIHTLKNSVLLTFDDGYKDHLDYVLPEFEKRHLAGIFFVPDYYGTAMPMDVNIIHLLLTKEENIGSYLSYIHDFLEEKSEKIDDYKKGIVFESRYDSREIELFKNLLQWSLPVDYRKEILGKLLDIYCDYSREHYFEKLYCSKNDLMQMIAAGNMIGGHSVSHGWLEKCSYEQQEKEITGSSALLNSLGKQKYLTFCYPYGSYNEDSVSLLKKHGYKASFTTRAREWEATEITKFEIPRFDTNDFPPISTRYQQI